MEYVFAEAVAADGINLRNSTVQGTNIPLGREAVVTEAAFSLHQMQSGSRGTVGDSELAKSIGLVMLGFALSVLMKSIACHRRYLRPSAASK